MLRTAPKVTYLQSIGAPTFEHNVLREHPVKVNHQLYGYLPTGLLATPSNNNPTLLGKLGVITPPHPPCPHLSACSASLALCTSSSFSVMAACGVSETGGGLTWASLHWSGAAGPTLALTMDLGSAWGRGSGYNSQGPCIGLDTSGLAVLQARQAGRQASGRRQLRSGAGGAAWRPQLPRPQGWIGR